VSETHDPIDVDADATWPDATRRWAEQQARGLEGSTEFLTDLDITLEQEDVFRRTFAARKLFAYHCTRLLVHESDDIRTGGLRLLDESLVLDRIAAAVAHGQLPDAARSHAERCNVYAIRNETGRAGQISFIVGRSVFDDDADGCDSLLRDWGGESIRGGPAEAPALETIGTPSIVVARLNLTRRHNDPYSYPPLAKVFVGTLLGLERRFAELHYRDPVAASEIDDIWQPGDPDYDRHQRLPR
jgi:hypothetical protein